MSDTTIPTKICSKCKQIKPATSEYFSPDTREKRDGWKSRCKVCCAAENREAYAAAKAREGKTVRRQHDPELDAIAKERRREYNIRWAAENREYRIEWRKKNRGRWARYARQYRVANREKVRETSRLHYLKRRNAPGSHTSADITRQIEAQKGRCYYCHKEVGDDFHVDHVIPISRGGSNDPSNLVIACPSCNRLKGDKLPHEWSRGGRLL